MTKELLNKNIEEVKEFKNKIDLLWKQCEEKKMDCDEASYQVEEIEKNSINHLSMYLIVKILDKTHNRKEDEQYDVTKIKISKEAEEEYRKHDKEVLSIINSDWTEEKINKEISWIYLMSGFVVDKDLTNFEIKVEDGFKRKK